MKIAKNEEVLRKKPKCSLEFVKQQKIEIFLKISLEKQNLLKKLTKQYESSSAVNHSFKKTQNSASNAKKR